MSIIKFDQLSSKSTFYFQHSVQKKNCLKMEFHKHKFLNMLKLLKINIPKLKSTSGTIKLNFSIPT